MLSAKAFYGCHKATPGMNGGAKYQRTFIETAIVGNYIKA